MKKHLFRLSVIVLVIVLAVVSFYMLYVHVPYYNYHHGLDEIRNEICEKNNYEYLDYFNEYHGKETYYILKVKVNDMEAYVAYNQKQELVDTYQGDIASQDVVKQAIATRYKEQKVQMNELDVAYENNKFVYYGKYQTKDTLWYVYYGLNDGEFVKMVKLGD